MSWAARMNAQLAEFRDSPHRLTVQADPRVAMMSYQNATGNLTERAEKLIQRHVISVLPPAGSGEPLNIAALEQGLHQLQLDLQGAGKLMERYSAAAFKRTAAHAATETQRILETKVPQWMRMQSTGDAQAAFVQRQVQLFQRAGRDQVRALRNAIAKYNEGDSLRADLERQIWVMRNRDKLIAHDEVHKLAEDEVRRMAEALGSPGGIYVTAKDEKVRHTHRAHDGLFFYWDALPLELREPNCRCKVKPVPLEEAP